MSNILKLLIQILSDGQFHSGSKLCELLNLTQDALTKLVNHLDQLGIECEINRTQDYRIPRGLELLDKTSLAQYLTSKNLHTLKNLLLFDEITSTNTYLADLAKSKDHANNKPHKENLSNNPCNNTHENDANINANTTNICLAESQTQGKGRLGRTWISPYAKNIYLSILRKSLKNPAQLGGLSIAMAVAVAKALQLYGLADEEIYLKWPNDVIWKQRKLAGILIELFAEPPDLCSAVIGVGVNVAMPLEQGQKIEQPWCDITQITGVRPQRNKLVGILIDQLLTALDLYQEHGLPAFIEKWKKLDACYNKPVKIITPTKTIAGIGQGIDDRGYFILEDEQGKRQTFASGEVSLRMRHNEAILQE